MRHTHLLKQQTLTTSRRSSSSSSSNRRSSSRSSSDRSSSRSSSNISSSRNSSNRRSSSRSSSDRRNSSRNSSNRRCSSRSWSSQCPSLSYRTLYILLTLPVLVSCDESYPSPPEQACLLIISLRFALIQHAKRPRASCGLFTDLSIYPLRQSPP